MNSKIGTLGPTKVKLTITATVSELANAKDTAIKKLGANVRLQGFREGKAPKHLAEKAIDQNKLQAETLESLVNQLYAKAVIENAIRPVAQPVINISKFVPFSTLEFTADVEVVGEIKLASYKTIKLARPKASVETKDVTDVLNNLNQQNAGRKDAPRAAKLGDEVTIDFVGRDAGTNQKISGADGKDYPLTLGSKQFIPGFEEELVGLKAGQDKEFTLTFPKDYGVASLQDKKVTFAVTAKKVVEIVLAKVDDAWAKKISPFKSLADLKADIKKQLAAEKQRQLDQQYNQDLLNKIAEKSSVAIPKIMVDDEIERLETDEKQNLAYRGQTFEEHLEAEGLTAEQHKEQKREQATTRVKASLVLTEISERENLAVSDDEINQRLDLMRQQYRDSQMQAELNKPSAREQIKSQLLTEKTFTQLATYASAA